MTRSPVTKLPSTKVIRFPDPVFLRSIVVVIGPRSLWTKEAERLGVPRAESDFSDGCAYTLALKKGGSEMLLILLPEYDGSVNWYDGLVHEVAHAVDRVFDSTCVPPGVASAETRAYLSGFYFSSVLRGLGGKTVKVALDGAPTT